MTKSWIGWLAFIVLVSVVGITSCQALAQTAAALP